jgi:hypothetical protein
MSHGMALLNWRWICPAAMVVALSGISAAISRSVYSQGPRVLMIGDSLTVGSFGDVIHDFLVARYGNDSVAVYAVCGSSPQHWLRDEPPFIGKCGYRVQNALRNEVVDFKNGHAPPTVVTPKLEGLIRSHRPSIVILQLGTNWMDQIEAGGDAKKQAAYDAILDRIVAAIRDPSDSQRGIIWITPPDSARFSKATQRTVEELITSAAQRDHFEIIPSRKITKYIPGATGGDGVHYNKEASTAWAIRLTRYLIRDLRNLEKR